MPFAIRPDPNAACPFCQKEGMVGHEREFVGSTTVTIYKCHHCNRTWQVPDDKSKPPSMRSKP
jgi:transposase-like protein